jgi:hypothetical protein
MNSWLKERCSLVIEASALHKIEINNDKTKKFILLSILYFFFFIIQ